MVGYKLLVTRYDLKWILAAARGENKTPLGPETKHILFKDIKVTSFFLFLASARIDFKKKHVGGIRSLRPTITNNLFR
jgi:hypothetical protein